MNTNDEAVSAGGRRLCVVSCRDANANPRGGYNRTSQEPGMTAVEFVM